MPRTLAKYNRTAQKYESPHGNTIVPHGSAKAHTEMQLYRTETEKP